MRYSKYLLAIIIVIILFSLCCNTSTTESNSDLLYAKTSKKKYSIHDTILLNIYNNTEDSVYFEYYDNIFVTFFEKRSNNNWISAELFMIPSGTVKNTRALKPDSIKQYTKYTNWVGESRIRIPYNTDGSTNFPDTLFSNIFTVE